MCTLFQTVNDTVCDDIQHKRGSVDRPPGRQPARPSTPRPRDAGRRPRGGRGRLLTLTRYSSAVLFITDTVIVTQYRLREILVSGSVCTRYGYTPNTPDSHFSQRSSRLWRRQSIATSPRLTSNTETITRHETLNCDLASGSPLTCENPTRAAQVTHGTSCLPSRHKIN